MSLGRKFLLLLLLVLSHHVDSGSIIKSLPGFEGPLPFELETGYIGIGEEEENQLFYYFVKSEKNPEEDPLLIWLIGGPGCSSIIGFSYEIGPVTFNREDYNATIPSMISTTYSWTKMANIIFLDQPAGAGFSYSRTPHIETSDTDEVRNIHEFLQKWLSKHPQFYSNPLYITGDSYAGMIVPALVDEISKGNYLCCEPPINIQGYILGNPITQIEIEINYFISYAHGMALISDEVYESMKRNCKGNYFNVDPRNTKCLELVEEYHKYHLYVLLANWANSKRVREALQIRKGTVSEWMRCNRSIPYEHDIKSSVPYHMNNSINGYRSLIFSGDHDTVMPFIATQAWIRSLNYSITGDWRPWMINDQIAGYTRTYANKMTFATVKGGGHTTEYKPNESFIMFQRWISGQPL